MKKSIVIFILSAANDKEKSPTPKKTPLPPPPPPRFLKIVQEFLYQSNVTPTWSVCIPETGHDR